MKLEDLKLWEPSGRGVELCKTPLWGFDQCRYAVFRRIHGDRYEYAVYRDGRDNVYRGCDPSEIMDILVEWNTKKMSPLELKCWRMENSK